MFEAKTKSANDVAASLKRQMGDEAQVVITDSDILRWIDDGQTEIVTNNQSLNMSKAVTSIVTDKAEYPLMQDEAFSGILLVNSIHYKNRRLRSATFQEAEEFMLTDTENAKGEPSLWYSVAGVIHLYPVPEENVDNGLSIFFTKAPRKVTSLMQPLDIPDSYFNALVEYAMSKAYEMEENTQMSQMKTQQFEKSLNIQQNRTVPQTAEFLTIRPDSEDGWY